jgi:hypothetical protein
LGKTIVSNELSNALKAQLFANESYDPFLQLITLSHDSFTSPIYLVDNSEEIVSNGNTFLPFPMQIILPQDDSDSDKQVKISFDNVSRFLIEELRSISTPINLKLEMVLASNPDIIEVKLEELQLRNIQVTLKSVEGTLVLDDFLRTELSSEKYGPSNFPGLFS